MELTNSGSKARKDFNDNHMYTNLEKPVIEISVAFMIFNLNKSPKCL